MKARFSMRAHPRRVIGVVAVAVLASFGISRAQQTRDARVRPEPAGTSTVTGVVVSDENADRPISRAIVTLSGGGLTLGRTAITGVDGRFTFSNLPAGDFTIRATKSGYIPAPYGARRPGRPGTPLTVADGQTSEIRIRLPRGAVIAGTIRTAKGEPAPGTGVEIVPVPRVATNLRVNVVPQTAVTDDRGVYRVYGLLPGDYLVAAIPPRPGFSASAGLPGMEMRPMGNNNLTARSAPEIDAIFRDLQAGSAVMREPIGPAPGSPRPPASPEPPPTYGFAPVYYPGTVLVGQASKITIRQAEEREGIDIAIDLVRTTTVQGVVSNPYGALPAIGLSILAADPRPNGAPMAAPVLSTPPGPDGRFEYTGLTPGRYVIWARSREGAPIGPAISGGRGGVIPTTSAPGSSAQLWAMAEIVASGEAISGVTLMLQPTIAIAGQVRFDASSLERPENLANVRISLTSETAPFGGMGNMTNFGGPPIPAAQVQPDGTFHLTGLVPGTYRLSATPPGAPGWWLRSAVLGDRDLLDLPLDVGVSGDDSRRVIVTFSDRPGEIAGSLRAPEGTPAPDYFVLVFPADRTLWRPGSRRVHTTRPATNGTFSVRGLPGGDYVVGALTDMDASDVHDPAFLEQVAAASIKVSLKDGEQKRQDIQIVR